MVMTRGRFKITSDIGISGTPLDTRSYHRSHSETFGAIETPRNRPGFIIRAFKPVASYPLPDRRFNSLPINLARSELLVCNVQLNSSHADDQRSTRMPCDYRKGKDEIR